MNSLMITPIGIGIIGIYSAIICVALLWPLFRLLRNSRWKLWIVSIVGFPLLAAPWAEEAWIAWHFNEACKDAGVKVYRQVEVDGYLDSLSPQKRRSVDSGSYPTPRKVDFEEGGYRYHEETLTDGGVSHHERVGDQILVSILDKPRARYLLRYAYQPEPSVHEEPIGWRLEKVERQVVDRETGEILGREIFIKRWAPIADALWAQFIGSTLTICPGPAVKPFVPSPLFPQVVLKPILKP